MCFTVVFWRWSDEETTVEPNGAVTEEEGAVVARSSALLRLLELLLELPFNLLVDEEVPLLLLLLLLPRVFEWDLDLERRLLLLCWRCSLPRPRVLEASLLFVVVSMRDASLPAPAVAPPVTPPVTPPVAPDTRLTLELLRLRLPLLPLPPSIVGDLDNERPRWPVRESLRLRRDPRVVSLWYNMISS